MNHKTQLKFQNKIIELTQDAYISDCGTQYIALGKYTQDEETYLVKIRWNITCNDINALEDASDACDWDCFEIEELGIEEV